MNIHYGLILPEMLLFGMLVLQLVLELIPFSSEIIKTKLQKHSVTYASIAILVLLLQNPKAVATTFGGMFLVDPLSQTLKIFFLIVLLFILSLSKAFFEKRTNRPAEFFLILWSSLIGFFSLVSSNHFLLLFISLEVITLSFYILNAYLKDSLVSIEAGIKYLIMGSLASAIFILGVGFLYIATGSLSFPDIREAALNNPSPLIYWGFFLTLAGAGFKIAAVPFQLWVPDVYEGAPTPAVAFLSVGSKAAGFAVLLRLGYLVFPAFDGLKVALFTFLAILTMLYGNLGALSQTNIKRLFGYSSIGHAGYLLIGLAAGGLHGTTAMLYYLIAYAITTLTAFYCITLVEIETENNKISSYQGLAKKCPFLAGMLFLALLSSAGIPPLAGFSGKFLILLAAVKSNLYWLTFIGALGVAVSLYYYLSVVRVMYFEEPLEEGTFSVSPKHKILLLILAVGILVVGFFQAPVYNIVNQAAVSLF